MKGADHTGKHALNLNTSVKSSVIDKMSAPSVNQQVLHYAQS